MSNDAPSQLPTNTPATFGLPLTEAGAASLTVLDCRAKAPASNPDSERPAVKRLLSGDGTNIIVFNFAAGQCLNDHRAAFPITVECIEGELEFGCGETTIELKPGTIAHLPAYVTHRVDCPAHAEGNNILVLHMLTGAQS